ncbi:MerR family transcriptional regulator [bacterium]|nr:MerR family transcriptional regulator [bacterium]
MKKSDGKTILEAVKILKKAGFESVGRQTIRQYEDAGLVDPVRKRNQYRLYSDSQIERLELILSLRGLNFSIEEIRTLFTQWDKTNRRSMRVFKEIRDNGSVTSLLETKARTIQKEYADQAQFILAHIIKKMQDKRTALLYQIEKHQHKIEQISRTCSMIDQVLSAESGRTVNTTS